MEFINREQGRKSEIFKGSREHGIPPPSRPAHMAGPRYCCIIREWCIFLSFSLFKDELNATRYCGPKEFVYCAGDIESKEGIKSENKLLSDCFHTVDKKYKQEINYNI